VIATVDIVSPVLYLGLWLLGLIILVSLALGWRVRWRDDDGRPEDFGDDFGDDMHELADQARSRRDQEQ
jgi:hypothetical protein